MYDGKMIQDVMNLSRNYWMTTMDLMANMQKQNEKMWNILLEQGVATQHEGHKMMQEWLNGTKQAQEHYNKLMENTWEQAEALFGTPSKPGK